MNTFILRKHRSHLLLEWISYTLHVPLKCQPWSSFCPLKIFKMHLHNTSFLFLHNPVSKRTTAAAWFTTEPNSLPAANRQRVEPVKPTDFGSAVARKLFFGSHCETQQFQEVATWLSASSSLSRLQSGCRWNKGTSVSLCLCLLSLILLSPPFTACSVKKTRLFFMCTTPKPQTHPICGQNYKLQQKFFCLKDFFFFFYCAPCFFFQLFLLPVSLVRSVCIGSLPPVLS